MYSVRLEAVRRSYRVRKPVPPDAGLWRRIAGVGHQDVEAVRGISFVLRPGERVGFLGRNGAGKTTTLRMIAGLVRPTSGSIWVDGRAPSLADRAFLKRLGFVSGQRHRLSWDLPATESFALYRALYEVPRATHERDVATLVDLLDASRFVDQPVRTMSLGQRMRCELVCALCHSPRVLLMDEPTIGLDVGTQAVLRRFLRTYVERNEATLLLTSHYMADIEETCDRAIVIEEGRVLTDSRMEELVSRYAPEREIELRVREGTDIGAVTGVGAVVASEGGRLVVRVPREQTVSALARLLALVPATDVSVREAAVGQVLAGLMSGALEAPGAAEG